MSATSTCWVGLAQTANSLGSASAITWTPGSSAVNVVAIA